MNAGTYKGTVREFNTATRIAKVVVPQLYDFKPIECDPFLTNPAVLETPILLPGQNVLVLWDGGQSNANPIWLLPGALPSSYPRGILAIGGTLNTGGYAIPVGSYIDITTLIPATKLELNRRYRIRWTIRAIGSAATNNWNVRLKLNGNPVGLGEVYGDVSTNYGRGEGEWNLNGDGSTVTIQLEATAGAAGISFHDQWGGGASTFYLEDLGALPA